MCFQFGLPFFFPLTKAVYITASATPNAEKFIKISSQHMLPSRHQPFQEHPCIFQQGNAKAYCACITKSWLQNNGVNPACSSNFLLKQTWTTKLETKVTNLRLFTLEIVFYAQKNELTKILRIETSLFCAFFVLVFTKFLFFALFLGGCGTKLRCHIFQDQLSIL